MQIYAHCFYLQKAGNKRKEYEDAFSPKHVDQGGHLFRFAVADGATETSFAGVWAKMLVRAYVRGSLGFPEGSDALARLRERWRLIVGKRPLPWYAEEKVRLGAAATFLGLTLEAPVEAQGRIWWRAVALGDSCLFHVRGDVLQAGFPIEKSADFTNQPALLSTNLGEDQRLPEHTVTHTGEARPDDSFYLMTDALACWFWASYEQGQAPWQTLRDLGTCDARESFSTLVRTLRKQKFIRNDDVTLFRIEILS